MKCKIPRLAREEIECPIFDDTNNCWYENWNDCKYLVDSGISYMKIATKQIKEDKKI